MIEYFIETKPHLGGVSVKVKDNDKLIGLADAYEQSVPMMVAGHSYRCADDLIDISYEYPQVMDNDNMRILIVNSVQLLGGYHRQGIGKLMYQHLIKGYLKKIRKPFVMIPDKCADTGATSDMAMRVWKSLKRQYPSSGYCLVIDL